MNLHVTNDGYGFYTVEIARRVQEAEFNEHNIIVNLSETATLKSGRVDYIPVNKAAYARYISNINKLDKVVFHPYNFIGYEFLTVLLEKYPHVKVYWVCWSYEYYNLPHRINKLYDPFSLSYVKSKQTITQKIKSNIKFALLEMAARAGIRKSYWQTLRHAYSLIHYFLSPLPTDYVYLKDLRFPVNIQYIPFAYLALEKLMPGLEHYRAIGNKLMIGHSSSPDGNHYEVIGKVAAIKKDIPVFLPLAYGDSKYGDLIANHAQSLLTNVEIMREKLEKEEYYKKLQEVSWAIINVKVQQGVGNIMGLIWMGAKVFLNSKSSIYIDFHNWGMIIFNTDEINEYTLSTKLTAQEVEHNREIMLQKFGEKVSRQYWDPILR